MSYEPLAIQENDYIIPRPDEDENDEFLDIWDRIWTPCRVIRIYKNGNLWARSDQGTLSWRGPVSGFQLAP
jgi:hypothetical protein